jgi:hypothetical protein
MICGKTIRGDESVPVSGFRQAVTGLLIDRRFLQKQGCNGSQGESRPRDLQRARTELGKILAHF